MKRIAARNDRFHVCEGVSAREFDGAWVVLDLVRGNYFGLDAIGGKVWLAVRDGKTPEQIAAALAMEYEADEVVILEDILRLLNDLVERTLVRIDE